MLCAKVMKRDPECVGEDDTALTAARRMRDENVGFLPVCDINGRPVGTLTDRDLTVRVLAAGRNGATRVSDCMSREVVACYEDEELQEAARLMARHQKARMIVLDEDGRLSGVISLSDIVDTDLEHAPNTIREVTRRELRA